VKDGRFNNPVRGRLNAHFFDLLERYMHGKYAAIKEELLSDLPDAIVELGPGAGANLRYLGKGTRLIAVEPNVQFHPVLRKRAEEHGISLDLHGLAGESLDLPSSSSDFVFASLVLCSVRDPQRVLSEVIRILKPGGRFACVEHVAAPHGSTLRAIQHTVERPWKWVFEGCELCRDTKQLLEIAGFSSVRVTSLTLPTIFVPIRPQIAALCVK
jgi:Methylase involved in ubiquinone/menaquinone biosynthesis